jgi:hypothetical protein
MAESCCKRVYGSGHSFSGSLCSVPAKSQVDGNWYCHIHNPEMVAKRRKENQERWDNESKRRQAAYRKEKAERAAASFLKIIVDGYDYNPGDSDLDNEQPIHVRMNLGDYRRAAALLHEVTQ